jgi:hypothetical protein
MNGNEVSIASWLISFLGRPYLMGWAVLAYFWTSFCGKKFFFEDLVKSDTSTLLK